MPLPLGVAKAVIADETHSLRFEMFAADLVSRLEGGTRVVTTSSNYDQARDGVSVGAGPRVVVCCSLADVVDDKVKADALKLGKTTKNFDRAYFCSSQKLTEYAADRLAAEFAKAAKCEAGKVTVLGRETLAKFGAHHDDVLRKHYVAEIHAAMQALAERSDASEQEHSLRLALSVAGTDDAARIREAVWAAALRLALADGFARSVGTISALLSNLLKLSATIRPDTLRLHLERGVADGYLQRDGNNYKLSPAGRDALGADEERVSAAALEGRTAFRDAVTSAIRSNLTTSQSNEMWLAMQNSLATLLYERGREILQLMAPLLGHGPVADREAPSSDPASATTRAPVHKDIVEPLARAAANVFQLPDQAEEVRLAISDLLHSGYGPAVDWLTRSCYAFVCACSLGLEARTQAALESIIERTSLVLDTDVVLSLLSPDEPPHASVESLTKEWREFGGQVLVTREVMSEVARHAWIAQKDYDQVRDLLPATHMDRQIVSKNAFVRGFGRLVEEGKAKPSHWNQWIAQFRGRADTDITPTRTALIKDRGFGEVPPATNRAKTLAAEVQKYIERRNQLKSAAKIDTAREEFIRVDKASRDASMFASLSQAIDDGHTRGDGRGTYLITSSARFRDIERRFRSGEATFILTVPAAAYLLSMVPGRALGLSALRTFLFDGRWSERTTDFELLALRIVRRSTEFDMPWAKRSSLLRDLRGRVESVARDRSERGKVTREAIQQVEESWMAGSEELPRALAKALDQVAADRKTEAQLQTAKARIRELEAQLAAERKEAGSRRPTPTHVAKAKVPPRKPR